MKLQAIHRFTSTASAVEDMTSIGEGKLSKNLKKFLTDEVTGKSKFKNETLAVSETKLGTPPPSRRFCASRLTLLSVLSWCHRQEAFHRCRLGLVRQRPLPRNPLAALGPC